MSLIQVLVKLVGENDLVTAHGKMSAGKEGSAGTYKGGNILQALRENKRLIKNDNGEEVFHIQFDSQHFKFKPGEEMIVPENVAWGFRNDSRVFVDRTDPLGSPFVPAIVEVEKWTPGTSKPVTPAPKAKPLSKTMCPECGKEQGSLTALAEHLLDVHSEATAEV